MSKEEEQPEEAQNLEKTTTRRRTALLEGACGQAGRLRICGQVVDILLPIELINEEWEPFHNLPASSLGVIRPIEDWNMSGVRGARLQMEVLKVEPQNFKLAQVEHYGILFSSPVFSSHGKGFFNYLLPARDHLEKGNYVVRIILRGIHSLRQSLLDLRYISKSSEQVLQKDQNIGYGKLCILEPDFQDYMLISDIDQTFLDTQIESKEGLIKCLGEKAYDKKTINGMAEFYRQLSSIQGESVPLFFLSASPHFFRRTFISLFDKYRIGVDALYLKYLSGVIDTLSDKVMQVASNPFQVFSGKDINSLISEGMKYVSTHVLSLFDQIGYKLEMLLQNRLMQATQSKEILIGDNFEGDFFIYVLYQLLLKGYHSQRELEDYLNQFRFQGQEVLTKENVQKLCKLREQNIGLHGKKNPVSAVWINNAKKERNENAMEEIIKTSLSPMLQRAYAQDPEIIPMRLCEKGLGMTLAAFDENILDLESVAAVFISSREEGQPAEELQASLEKFVFQKKKRITLDDLVLNFL